MDFSFLDEISTEGESSDENAPKLPTINKFESYLKAVKVPVNDDEESRMRLIRRIEKVVLDVLQQITSGKPPVLTYFVQRTPEILSNLERESPNNFQRRKIGREETTIWPRCRKPSSVEFRRGKDKMALIFVVMSTAHRLLITNAAKTRRSFYYDLKKGETKDLASSQRYVDEAVNRVADLLDCAPWELKLLATSKGLIAGDLILSLLNDQIVDCTVPGGALIPQIVSNVTGIRTKADFVLIVEKDSVFQKLLSEGCPRALNCILITGKGYPDVATRMLVKLLSESLRLPGYIVVDADPFGLDIMLVYRFGSVTLSKQNDTLSCPNIRWLGILPSELSALGIKTIPLTSVDLSKLTAIESRSYLNEVFLKQSRIMRENGKAEIEALCSSSRSFFTSTYLPCKIRGSDFV